MQHDWGTGRHRDTVCSPSAVGKSASVVLSVDLANVGQIILENSTAKLLTTAVLVAPEGCQHVETDQG